MKKRRKTVQRHSEISWKDFPYRKDEEGRPLCRKCGVVLTGKKRAWCSKQCVRAIILMTHWPTIRRTILRRDHRTCVLCGGWATEVDHIIEIADGGSFWKPDNLRALCRNCHQNKTNEARKTRNIRKNSINAQEGL